MSLLNLHNLNSAPLKSKELLQNSIKDFGWIPNQSAYMAESPSLLAAYQRAHDLFIETSFNEEEKAVVWLTTGIENKCSYTVSAHSYIAIKSGVSRKVVNAILYKNDELSKRLTALQTFTKKVIHCKGQLNKNDIDVFLDAGFTTKNILETILGVSQKNMSTILNNIAKTEIDDHFKILE